MKSAIEFIVDFFRAVIPADIVARNNIIPAYTQTDRPYPSISIMTYGGYTSDSFYGMIKKVHHIGNKTLITYAYDWRVTLRVISWSNLSRQEADNIAMLIQDALHRDWNDDHTLNYWRLREENHIYNAVQTLWDNMEPDDEIRDWATVQDYFLVMENEWVDIQEGKLAMDLEPVGALVIAVPCVAHGESIGPTVTTRDEFVLATTATCTAEAETSGTTTGINVQQTVVESVAESEPVTVDYEPGD